MKKNNYEDIYYYILPLILLIISVIIFLFFSFSLKKEMDLESEFKIFGTGEIFKDYQNKYRCYFGVAYIAPRNNSNAVVLLDEKGKPRLCKSI